MLYVLGSAENPVREGARGPGEPTQPYSSPDGVMEVSYRDFPERDELESSAETDRFLVVLSGSGTLSSTSSAEPFEKGDVLVLERSAPPAVVDSSTCSTVEIKIHSSRDSTDGSDEGTGRVLVVREADAAFVQFAPDDDHVGEMINRVSQDYTSTDELFHFGFQDFQGSKANPEYNGIEMVHVIQSGSGTWHIAERECHFTEGDIVIHESPLAAKNVVSEHETHFYLWRWRSQDVRARGPSGGQSE